jgi:hypothetical protein
MTAGGGKQSPPKKVITDVINSEDEFVSNNGEVVEVK